MLKSPSILRFYDYTHGNFSYGLVKGFELKPKKYRANSVRIYCI